MALGAQKSSLEKDNPLLQANQHYNFEPITLACQLVIVKPLFMISQGSSSSSFALLLSSGFHFSIFFATLKNSASSSPSSPLSRFPASSDVSFGTSAKPLQFPANRCVRYVKDSCEWAQEILRTVLIKPISYAISFRPLRKFLRWWARARRSYARLFTLWTSSGLEQQISVPK